MIIFINGSINSGKSTIAKLLADKISNSALLEVDALRNFIKWMPLEESIPINLENTVAVIKVFARNNINVIVPYPLDKEDYNYLTNQLREFKNDLYTFTLSPRLEIVLQNRGSREITEWEKERINHHYNTGISSPDFGIIIDNSDETPEETTDKILQSLNKV